PDNLNYGCFERGHADAPPRSWMSPRRLMGLPQGRGSRIKYNRSGAVHRSKSGHSMSALGVYLPAHFRTGNLRLRVLAFQPPLRRGEVFYSGGGTHEKGLTWSGGESYFVADGTSCVKEQ